MNIIPLNAANEKDAEVDAATAELLETLSPLESLAISGAVRQRSFDVITAHHAEKLRVLNFYGEEMEDLEPFALSLVSADQLAQRCNRLEELHLQMARTRATKMKQQSIAVSADCPFWRP